MLTEAHKVGALLLTIDQQLAADVMGRMSEDVVEMLTRAMKELERMAVDESDLRSVLVEVTNRLKNDGVALGDITGSIETMLTSALGADRGREVIANVEKQTLAQRPLAMFEQLPAEELAGLLTEEHPQIISVFLAHMNAEASGNILSHLPEELRSDIVRRIATLGRSSPEVVQRVIDVLRGRVRELGLSTSRSEPKAWIKKAASILNRLNGDQDVLEKISSVDEAIAQQLREEMFTFDDLSKLDKKSMQKVLGSIDTGVLAVALKACSPETEESVFNNLSKRARDMVADERDSKGPMPLSEVLESQKEILEQVRQLIESGDVIGPGGGGEEMV